MINALLTAWASRSDRLHSPARCLTRDPVLSVAVDSTLQDAAVDAIPGRSPAKSTDNASTKEELTCGMASYTKRLTARQGENEVVALHLSWRLPRQGRESCDCSCRGSA